MVLLYSLKYSAEWHDPGTHTNTRYTGIAHRQVEKNNTTVEDMGDKIDAAEASVSSHPTCHLSVLQSPKLSQPWDLKPVQTARLFAPSSSFIIPATSCARSFFVIPRSQSRHCVRRLSTKCSPVPTARSPLRVLRRSCACSELRGRCSRAGARTPDQHIVN
eukprot:SAG31_NODE_298_length_18125_cov_27.373350_8_plen_161_part_00